jgi:hypothetical protein
MRYRRWKKPPSPFISGIFFTHSRRYQAAATWPDSTMARQDQVEMSKSRLHVRRRLALPSWKLLIESWS